MGRVRTFIEVDGRKYWTLFDSGAENTYVTENIAKKLTTRKLQDIQTSRLGGKVHKVREVCILQARIRNKPIITTAFVVAEIGYDREAKRKFDVLVGAIAMQNWGIELNLKRETLDLSKYPDEFMEF